jgi:hypothetical protein
MKMCEFEVSPRMAISDDFRLVTLRDEEAIIPAKVVS